MDVPSKGRGEGEITYPKVKDNFSHVWDPIKNLKKKKKILGDQLEAFFFNKWEWRWIEMKFESQTWGTTNDVITARLLLTPENLSLVTHYLVE